MTDFRIKSLHTHHTPMPNSYTHVGVGGLGIGFGYVRSGCVKSGYMN